MNRKIIIVDDDAEVLEVIELVVSEINRSLKTFTKSIEAKDYILNNHKDILCIISDFNMPNLNGLDLYNEVKKTNLPFILLSGYLGDIKSTEDNLMLLSKPFSIEELSAIIQQILNN